MTVECDQLQNSRHEKLKKLGEADLNPGTRRNIFLMQSNGTFVFENSLENVFSLLRKMMDQVNS